MRGRIISYVSPHISLFPTTYALVFGTRHGINKFADDTASLYHRGYFKRLIISGGITEDGAPPEAELLFRAFANRAIPNDAIVLEDKATHTGDNVRFSRKMVRDLDIEEILLIGKVSSKRRYVMTVRKQWPEIQRMCCHGVNYFSCEESHWWKDAEFRKRVISECRKIPSYIENNMISEVTIVDGVIINEAQQTITKPT
jgi:uncharacterized SAM-binding protein YcdF (DUF218 family)